MISEIDQTQQLIFVSLRMALYTPAPVGLILPTIRPPSLQPFDRSELTDHDQEPL